jgi:hypothetical protein
MEFFFITYGNNLIGCYSVIKADDYSTAREIAYNGTDNGKFAFFYEGKEELQRQIDRGYLDRGEVPLQPMVV